MIAVEADTRRVAIEIIATLCYIKSTLVDLIIKPSGIPASVYKPLIYKRDDVTGQKLSKRQIAPLLLDGAAKLGIESAVVHSLLEIAAGWKDFHLAKDEFVARATVQKAQEILNRVNADVRSREIAKDKEIEDFERRQQGAKEREAQLLLTMFDELAFSSEPQQRGYLLQDLLNRLFDLNGIAITQPFTRNNGGEQIDGGFRLEGWRFLVECRWRKKLDDIRMLDGLLGQVLRSGRQAMGLYLSVEGWSQNVPLLLKQNPQKCILLMNGHDLRTAIAGNATLETYLNAMCDHLSFNSEPHLSVGNFLNLVHTDLR